MTAQKPQTTRRTATMHDVARAADVSAMTVSNVFRQPQRVQEETRLKVLGAAAELGYVPNLSAGTLAAGRSLVIGAAVPSIRNSSFYRYVTGLKQGCDAHGRKLVLMLADTPAQELEAVEAFIGLRVAGMVLIGNNHLAETADLIGKGHIPLVESWLQGDALDMAIGYDIAAAMRMACRRHIAAGRRRIGLVTSPDRASRRFRDRMPVFRDEMKRAGLRDDLIVEVDEPHGFSGGPQALDALLALEPEVDAAICPTDVTAASMVLECARRGIDVPGRLAVIGWGDYEMAAALSPALTTVKPHPFDMGRGAIDMLIAREEGGATVASVDTGFEMVVRESA